LVVGRFIHGQLRLQCVCLHTDVSSERYSTTSGTAARIERESANA
jgi:hypothetical protein